MVEMCVAPHFPNVNKWMGNSSFPVMLYFYATVFCSVPFVRQYIKFILGMKTVLRIHVSTICGFLGCYVI
jgi:hypothetical protein